MKRSKAETKILCEEIKRKYSILDYVKAKGIPIKDMGTRYFIVCPFHKDINPSLCIEDHGDVELFYCFGCKKKGTIIDFYAEYEHVSLGQAIEHLGQGIEFDFDISSLLDEFDERKENTSIAEMNIAISIHCFEYLSMVRSKLPISVVETEFNKMDAFYQRIDNVVKEGNEEKMIAYYKEICIGDFLTTRLKQLEESNEN